MKREDNIMALRVAWRGSSSKKSSGARSKVMVLKRNQKGEGHVDPGALRC